jgi:hypothetical protein
VRQPPIGALLIGQNPRPDLVEPLAEALPGWEMVQVGALDGLTVADLPSTAVATYPLTTKMRDGAAVAVEEQFLTPLLQAKLDELEGMDVAATILLCAGTFAELRGKRPLLKPFNLARNLLQTCGFQRIGLIAPIVAQEVPIQARWREAGFETAVWTANLNQQDNEFQQNLQTNIQTHHLDCILLDYVGHPLANVQKLQQSVTIPVIDLGSLAIRTLVETLHCKSLRCNASTDKK